MNVKFGAGTAWVAAGLMGAAFGGPQTDVRAAAAAAGTLFEAAPFVLAAWIASRAARREGRPARQFATWIGLAGCGCAGAELPGALALPAVALCAIAFGPLVAVARTLVALALVAGRRSGLFEASLTRGPSPDDVADPFATLATLGAAAFAASLAIDALGGRTAAIPCAGLLAFGLVLGAVAPCATAGIAIAAGLAHDAPWAAGGVLATTGLVSPFGRAFGVTRTRTEGRDPRRARVACLLLGTALAALAIRGPSGLVTPRLLIPIGFAALAAFTLSGSLRSRIAHPWLIPAMMLAVLLAPPAPPPSRAHAGILDDAYPGESLIFSGAATRSGSRTTLSRFVITCCRIDAAPVAVSLDRAVSVRDGTWLRARGTLVRDSDGTTVLRADDVDVTRVPADPFLYR